MFLLTNLILLGFSRRN